MTTETTTTNPPPATEAMSKPLMSSRIKRLATMLLLAVGITLGANFATACKPCQGWNHCTTSNAPLVQTVFDCSTADGLQHYNNSIKAGYEASCA